MSKKTFSNVNLNSLGKEKSSTPGVTSSTAPAARPAPSAPSRVPLGQSRGLVKLGPTKPLLGRKPFWAQPKKDETAPEDKIEKSGEDGMRPPEEVPETPEIVPEKGPDGVAKKSNMSWADASEVGSNDDRGSIHGIGGDFGSKLSSKGALSGKGTETPINVNGPNTYDFPMLGESRPDPPKGKGKSGKSDEGKGGSPFDANSPPGNENNPQFNNFNPNFNNQGHFNPNYNMYSKDHDGKNNMGGKFGGKGMDGQQHHNNGKGKNKGYNNKQNFAYNQSPDFSQNNMVSSAFGNNLGNYLGPEYQPNQDQPPEGDQEFNQNKGDFNNKGKGFYNNNQQFQGENMNFEDGKGGKGEFQQQQRMPPPPTPADSDDNWRRTAVSEQEKMRHDEFDPAINVENPGFQQHRNDMNRQDNIGNPQQQQPPQERQPLRLKPRSKNANLGDRPNDMELRPQTDSRQSRQLVEDEGYSQEMNKNREQSVTGPSQNNFNGQQRNYNQDRSQNNIPQNDGNPEQSNHFNNNVDRSQRNNNMMNRNEPLHQNQQNGFNNNDDQNWRSQNNTPNHQQQSFKGRGKKGGQDDERWQNEQWQGEQQQHQGFSSQQQYSLRPDANPPRTPQQLSPNNQYTPNDGNLLPNGSPDSPVITPREFEVQNVPSTALIINVSQVLRRLNGNCSLLQLKRLLPNLFQDGTTMEQFIQQNPHTFEIREGGRVVFLKPDKMNDPTISRPVDNQLIDNDWNQNSYDDTQQHQQNQHFNNKNYNSKGKNFDNNEYDNNNQGHHQKGNYDSHDIDNYDNHGGSYNNKGKDNSHDNHYHHNNRKGGDNNYHNDNQHYYNRKGGDQHYHNNKGHNYNKNQNNYDTGYNVNQEQFNEWNEDMDQNWNQGPQQGNWRSENDTRNRRKGGNDEDQGYKNNDNKGQKKSTPDNLRENQGSGRTNSKRSNNDESLGDDSGTYPNSPTNHRRSSGNRFKNVNTNDWHLQEEWGKDGGQWGEGGGEWWEGQQQSSGKGKKSHGGQRRSDNKNWR